MGRRFASTKRALGICDVCGFTYKLRELREVIVKGRDANIKACYECWDPDHPQNDLGKYPVDDPQALRDPRPDSAELSEVRSQLVPSGFVNTRASVGRVVTSVAYVFDGDFSQYADTAALFASGFYTDSSTGDAAVDLFDGALRLDVNTGTSVVRIDFSTPFAGTQHKLGFIATGGGGVSSLTISNAAETTFYSYAGSLLNNGALSNVFFTPSESTIKLRFTENASDTLYTFMRVSL